MIRGVGVMGYGKYKSTVNKKRTREYTAWCMMLRRCYDKKLHKKHPTYSNCTCDPEWHNFQNFCKDIEKIQGYAEWKANNIKMQLDKDSIIKGNKHYSKSTCMFLSQHDNVVISKITGKTYNIRNINTGETKSFSNQSEFARENNFNSKGLNNMLTGYRNIFKGWVLA